MCIKWVLKIYFYIICLASEWRGLEGGDGERRVGVERGCGSDGSRRLKRWRSRSQPWAGRRRLEECYLPWALNLGRFFFFSESSVVDSYRSLEF